MLRITDLGTTAHRRPRVEDLDLLILDLGRRMYAYKVARRHLVLDGPF
jgi:hypothetical protein